MISATRGIGMAAACVGVVLPLEYRLFARRDSRGEFKVTASSSKEGFTASSATTTFVFE